MDRWLGTPFVDTWRNLLTNKTEPSRAKRQHLTLKTKRIWTILFALKIVSFYENNKPYSQTQHTKALHPTIIFNYNSVFRTYKKSHPSHVINDPRAWRDNTQLIWISSNLCTHINNVHKFQSRTQPPIFTFIQIIHIICDTNIHTWSDPWQTLHGNRSSSWWSCITQNHRLYSQCMMGGYI
jgi:hypothetical protein